MIGILSNESFLILLAISTISAIGMNLVYITGQLNLGQAGFLAIGAYTTAVLEVEFGLGLWLTLPASALIAALVAVPVAIGANRLRGIYLIMGTLAAGEVIRVSISNMEFLGGVQGYSGQSPVDLSQALVTLAIILAIAVSIMASPLGLKMRSIFDDEDAAAACGVNTRLVKILAVLISAAVVAVAGGLLAKFLLFIAPRDFGITVSFTIALYTLLGGVQSLVGAVVGAFGITLMLEVLRNIEGISWIPASLHWADSWRFVIFGVIIIVVMWRWPEGIISRQGGIRMSRPFRPIRDGLSRFFRIIRFGNFGDPEVRELLLAARTRPMRDRSDKPILSATNITYSFGGLVAVDGASLEVYERELVALIGANGAGKSTLINVIAGRYRCQDGDIVLDGASICGLKAYQRCARGISRTFQTLRPLAHLTADESVRLGSFASVLSDGTTAEHVLELFDLEQYRDDLPSRLSLAVQRRVGIARAYASLPQVIFLDEPSAGLNAAERTELGTLIERLRELGSSVVLVDHNLDLALGIADRVVVLDQGQVIATGSPKEIIADERVQEAYLGRETTSDRPPPEGEML